jgi:uncharacterized protein (DUF58 family)
MAAPVTPSLACRNSIRREPAGTHATLGELRRLEYAARGISLLPRQPIHSLLSGRHGTRLRGRGLTFEEIRPYRAGDDIRSMDWKATARLREPHVRVFSEERDRPTMLLVDQRSLMYFGSQRATKSVTAATVAAIAAWASLAAGDRVGAVIIGDEECVEIKPHRSRRNVMRILGDIARLNALLPGPRSLRAQDRFHHAFERVLHHQPHDGLIIAVVGFYGLDPRTAQLATRISTHNDVLCMLTYDPLEAVLPASDGMVASDGVEDISIPSSSEFSRRYQRATEQRLTNIRRLLRRLRVPVIPVCTADPVLDQLEELLGLRRHA